MSAFFFSIEQSTSSGQCLHFTSFLVAAPYMRVSSQYVVRLQSAWPQQTSNAYTYFQDLATPYGQRNHHPADVESVSTTSTYPPKNTARGITPEYIDASSSMTGSFKGCDWLENGEAGIGAWATTWGPASRLISALLQIIIFLDMYSSILCTLSSRAHSFAMLGGLMRITQYRVHNVRVLRI